MGEPESSVGSPQVPGFNPVNRQPSVVAVIHEAIQGSLNEVANSPEIDLGEHAQFSHTFRGDYEVCKANIIHPGGLLADGDGNLFRVLNCKLRHAKANRGVLVYVLEWTSGARLVAPPDEFDIDPIEFNPAVEKNPLYSAGEPTLTLEDICRAKQANEAPQILSRSENAGNPYDVAVDPEKADLFTSLVDKLRLGIDTYYLAGLKVVWSRFYFAPQVLDRGGYIQAPGSNDHGDIVPAFFIRDEDHDLTLPGDANFSWLRLADKITYARTWWRVTRTWIGGPDGNWDIDLYKDFNDPDDPPIWATNPGRY